MKKAIAIAALFLAACGGMPAADREAMQADIRSYSGSFTAAVKDDPELAPLWKKTAIQDENITFDMLAIPEKVAPGEKPALLKVGRAYFTMTSGVVSSMRAHGANEQIVALLDGYYTTSANLGAQLHNGDITWGAYNQKRKELRSAYDKGLAQIRAEIEAQNQQAAFQTGLLFQQAFQGIAVQQAINAPRSTICNRIGNAVYCN